MQKSGGKPAVTGAAGNKRAYKRIPVRLGAMVKLPSGKDLACTVRDFSAGGMLLFVGNGGREALASRMPINSQVTITCRVKQKEVRILAFPGVVVRHSESGFAIRLDDPQLENLRMLQKVAQIQGRQHQEEATGISEQFAAKQDRPADGGVDYKKLIRSCHQIAINAVLPMITRFQDGILERFASMNKGSGFMAGGTEYFDATQRIESAREAMSQLFAKNVGEALESNEVLDAQDREYPDLSLSDGALSLVDDDSYESWLADTTTIDKVESHHREQMYELHIRLSEIYGVKIDKENNPYRPALYVDAFDQVVKSLAFSHSLEMLCHEEFRNILVEDIGEIYAAMNRLMVESDVIPVIKYHVNKSKTAATPGDRTGEEFEVDTVPVVEDTSVVPPVPTPPVQQAQAPKPQVQQPQVQQAPPPPPPPQFVAPEDVQSIFNLVGDLQDMQENLAAQDMQSAQELSLTQGELTELQHRARQMAAQMKKRKQAHKTVQAAPKGPAYKVDDLVKVLSTISIDVPDHVAEAGEPMDEGERISAGKRLLSTLEKLGGSAGQIGRRERQIINVSDKIFEFVAEDQQVSSQIKQWIDRLEMPILKMALSDETLFLDREHQVRQVINKIAQLEMLVEESGRENPQNSMVKNAIEWIVDLVNREFNSSPDVFDRAIKQLDILLNTQGQVYEQNVSTLIERIKKKKDKLLDDSEITDHDKWEVHEQVRDEWVKKVKRIKEQDWVVVNDGSGRHDRLRVGFVDDQKQQIALVNLLGNLDRGVTFTEVAKGLHDGQVEFIGSENEPAMDRAQYTMLQELHKELVDQAVHDHLTGLFDRRELYRRLDEELGSVSEDTTDEPENIRCSVAFIDIDKFKLVNEACGYDGGDEFIIAIARELNQDLPEGAYVGRIGADEFALVLPHTHLEEAVEFLEDRLEKIHAKKFIWKDHSFHQSLSVGLVHVKRAGETSSEVMREAENSCATAKTMGGNRIMVYHAGNRGLSHNRHVVKWGAELDRIIENEGLFLRCQRIMPIRGGGMRKNKYEILLGVREMHDETISDYFLEAAERFNRMPDIDRWVLDNAFEWMLKNHRKLNELEAVAINLSGQSLNDEHFLSWVTERLSKLDVPMEKICFEITETTGISNLSDASDFILKTKECGCQFSLDDFGAGMSSYAYLKQLPVDYLKIDGAFIRELLNNPNDEAVVKSVCEIGHFMGKRVIAEYVEDARTLKKLQALKVDYAQGFGIEKPKMLSEL